MRYVHSTYCYTPEVTDSGHSFRKFFSQKRVQHQLNPSRPSVAGVPSSTGHSGSESSVLIDASDRPGILLETKHHDAGHRQILAKRCTFFYTQDPWAHQLLIGVMQAG